MTKLPEGKTRLDLVRERAFDNPLKKRGRMVVNLDRLIEDPNNERKVFRNMAGLIASIKRNGLIEPITVTEEPGSDVFRIITGHRRFRAAKAAGLAQVEVIIREPEAEPERRLKSVVSNLQREDIGPVEMAEALQSLMDDGQFAKRQDLADAIGKSAQWVSDVLAVLGMPVDLQEKVRTSEVLVSYDAATKIARIGDSDRQGELVDAVLSGATVREIRDKIDTIKGKPKQPIAPVVSGKPKKVFHTKYQITIVAQSETETISEDRVLGALQEAIGRAVNASPAHE